MLITAIALTGCGDNKTNQKLLGTQIVTGNANGTTIQSAVTQNVLVQTTANLFSAMNSATAVAGAPARNFAPERAATNISRHFDYTVGGGTLDLVLTGSYTSTYDSGVGAVSAIESITSTFTGITVAIGGKNYTVTGNGTDNGSFNTHYAVASETLTSASDVFSITRTGSITITGPDCNGTWNYNLSSNGSVALTAPTALAAAKTFTGSVTHDGLIAGSSWHDTAPITLTVN